MNSIEKKGFTETYMRVQHVDSFYVETDGK